LDQKPNMPQSGRQKGGYARSERLSSAQRSEIAARAAQARWNREPTNVNLANIEDFQMTTDAIDAADILATELSEQAALLSQAGAEALSNGKLAKAKAVISAIEQTQALCNRAEELKAEIVALHSIFVAPSKPDADALAPVRSEEFESVERDPAIVLTSVPATVLDSFRLIVKGGYKNPPNLKIADTDVVTVLIGYNPKKGALNRVYFDAVKAAIDAGKRTVREIDDYVKESPRFIRAHGKIRAEIRHNVGRGYYSLTPATAP
jgi:hypothetical protein